MRKVTILLLIMLFVFSMAGFASAEPANITEALATANDELRAKFFGGNYFFTQNIQGKPINEANWAKSKLFTYGSPQEASPGTNDFDPVTKQYRYHGYTRNGEKYTNTFFRNDTTETVDVNNANWIAMPWRDPAVQNFVTDIMHEPELTSTPFNNDPALLNSIVMGMENVTQYNPYIKFKRDSRQWQSFVHILQPPTKHSFGMGRLFRQVGGQLRYLTIPLTPLASGYDIKITITGQTSYKCPGKTIAVNPKLKVTRKDNIPGSIQATVKGTGGTSKLSRTITLAPGESKEVEYSFPAAPGTYVINAETWPVGQEDIYPPDNTFRRTIVVTKADLPPNDRDIRTNLGGR